MKMQMKYRIRRWVFVLILLLAFAWAMDVTTPDECKVDVEQMSQFCKDLIYP